MWRAVRTNEELSRRHYLFCAADELVIVASPLMRCVSSQIKTILALNSPSWLHLTLLILYKNLIQFSQLLFLLFIDSICGWGTFSFWSFVNKFILKRRLYSSGITLNHKKRNSNSFLINQEMRKMSAIKFFYKSKNARQFQIRFFIFIFFQKFQFKLKRRVKFKFIFQLDF